MLLIVKHPPKFIYWKKCPLVGGTVTEGCVTLWAWALLVGLMAHVPSSA